MNISFEKAYYIINENKVNRVYCIEDSKEKDYGKPKGKGTNGSSIGLFECGDDIGVKPFAPMIAIMEDRVSEITFNNKELIFGMNNGTKYKAVIS